MDIGLDSRPREHQNACNWHLDIRNQTHLCGDVKKTLDNDGNSCGVSAM